MPADVAAKVKRIIRDQLGVDPDRVHDDARFVEDLRADSVALVELTLALEAEFDIDIAEDDVAEIRSVRDAVSYVHERTRRYAQG